MRILNALSGNVGIKSAMRRRTLSAKGALRRMIGGSNEDVATYERMRSDNNDSGSLYTAGEFWAHHNRRHADAIWGGGLDKLRNEFFNRTFSGPEPESRQVYKALLFLYLKHVQAIDTEGFLDNNEDPEIGGTSDQELIDGRRLSLDFLQSVEEMCLIKKAWKDSGREGEPKIIVELGGGYGRLAYVCKKMLPECTYIMLDLPEALTCAQSWLARVLPQEVVPYSTKIKDEDLQSGKVMLFLPHMIENIPTKSIDAFINIYSFAEMPKESINNYFHHLDRITDGVFFTKQRKYEKNTLDDVEISKDNYPIPEHWKQLTYSTSSLYDQFFQESYNTSHNNIKY